MRATDSALPSPVALPVSLAASVAAVTSARATTARRKSSADGPSSLTNAVTSQEDIKMRARPILTVVMERPRVGGVAMSCSQICSRQASKSRLESGSAGGSGFATGAGFEGVLEFGEAPVLAGCDARGADAEGVRALGAFCLAA